MATRQINILEQTYVIKAGYFYTFGYIAKTKMFTDVNPVIYCAYAPKDSNNFIGINVHYFNKDIMVKIILEMQKMQFILNDDIQHIFNGIQLNKCFSNIGFGMKEYNKTRIINGKCYRIRNKYIPEFLQLPSKFFMTNDIEQDMQRELSKK